MISSPIGHQLYFRKEKRGLSVNEKPRYINIFLMLVTGLEPATPSLRVKCTTSCATPA